MNLICQCNEAKPDCDNCQRHYLRCIYDRATSQGGSTTIVSSPGGNTTADLVATSVAGLISDSEIVEPPETKQRRMLEAKLMHYYLTTAGDTIAIDEKTDPIFSRLAPKLSFQSDALLYAIYSVAAFHAAKYDGTTDHGEDVQHQYLSMSIREHSKDLSRIGASNADVLCITSTMLRICSFIILQERVRQPYSPPVAWLTINASASAVFYEVQKVVRDDGKSIISRMLKSSPIILDENERFNEISRQGLEHLMQRDQSRDAGEPWDSEIDDAYASTLSYLGGILAVARHSEATEVCRRLVIFPMLIKAKFVELVQQRQPRAMVFLAHYFALLSLCQDLWWIGDAGILEVCSLVHELPTGWSSLLEWPLKTVTSSAKLPIAFPPYSD